MWLQRVGQDLVTEQQQLVFGEFALRLFLHPSPALLCNAGVCVYVCVCVCRQWRWADPCRMHFPFPMSAGLQLDLANGNY